MGCDDDISDSDADDDDDDNELAISFTLSDTGQSYFYNADGDEISEPGVSDDYYGQGAQFSGTGSSFQDNDDETVTDLNTGLMWQKTPDFDRHQYYDAFDYVEDIPIGDFLQ